MCTRTSLTQLGLIVKKERPDLEEQNQMLVVQVAKGKNQLAELDDKVGMLCKLSLPSPLISLLFGPSPNYSDVSPRTNADPLSPEHSHRLTS